MDDLERTFREGLRDAAARKPPLGPVDFDEVTVRSVDAVRRRRPARWLAAAAAAVLVAAIGAGAYVLNGRGVVPAIPAVPAASPAASPLATDVPSVATCRMTDVGSVLYPFRVSVRVFSDGRTGGLAKLTTLYLRANGFHVLTYSEASSRVTATTIRGSATDSPEVKLVEKFFPGAVVEGDGRADHSVDVLVVDEPAQVNDPDASVPVSGALCLPAIPGESLEVRVRNASGMTFDSVVVEFLDGTRDDYGKLTTGEASDYIGVSRAYGYASVTVITGGRTLRFQPEDHFGEEQFRHGHYTYELGVDRDGLTIGLSLER